MAQGVLWATKLPIALLSAFIFPALFLQTISEVAQSVDGDKWLFWWSAGLVFLLGWTVILRWSVSRFMLILEHEMIHVVLAWLTGLKVEKLEVNHNIDGGLAMIETPANWLVFLGPYFVPLTLYISSFIVHALPLSAAGLEVALGAILGYEIAANTRELHPHQTDFQRAGWWFSFMLLPSAILLTYGGALRYALTGDLMQAWIYMTDIAAASFQQTLEFVISHVQ